MNSALGFRVKSGWAAAILLSGGPDSPVVLDSRRVELSDPAETHSRFPYHASFELPDGQGPKETARLVKVVRQVARRSLARLFADYNALDSQLTGAGLVAGSLTDPETIKGEHIRAHAQEGLLFRSVVAEAVEELGLPLATFTDKKLFEEASRKLQRPADQIKKDLQKMGKDLKGRWRTDEKAAALAAWIVLR